MRRLETISLFLLLAGCGPIDSNPDRLAKESVRRLAQIEGSISVPSIERPVEILRDRWGVAHIYADTLHDLFFAQGYVAAQDRLYQIEIWRRTGAGELAEVFGAEYLSRDRIARLVRYRGDMVAEWASYSPQAREIAEAFTSGINAYVEQNLDSLPIEFDLLGFAPGHWEPEHVLLRIAGLLMVRNVSQEIARARLVSQLGVEATQRWYPTDPRRDLRPDPELDLEGIDDRVTEAYRRAVSIPVLPESEGSNNWVVSADLSATGAPLLASDPHRPVILPSLRYLVHLNGPGWNVIGSGEPALPGVAIGHNDRVGWGFTIVQYDAADLFVEKTNPENRDQYLLEDEWLDMRIEREEVLVKGRSQPESVELKFSRNGPVIWEDPANNRAVALRWAGQEPGTAGYLGSLALGQTRDWDGFVEAMAAWKVPAENIVYADIDGNIGWIPAGLVPVREGWSGLLPVPAYTGKYGWSGFRAIDELPQIKNPDSGYVATANHNILPPGYPHDLGFDWSARYRFDRVDEVLRDGGPFTVEDFQRLQLDETSLPARELVGMLRQSPAWGSEAAALFEGWNFVLDVDSSAAALFEAWMRRIPAQYLSAAAPADSWELIGRYLQLPRLIELLRESPDEMRHRVMADALEEAAAELSSTLGATSSTWRWGELHRIGFRHPLANSAVRRAVFDLEPVERGGDGFTPNATRGPGYLQSSGASYRHILDLADWDRSVFTSTPGQSGQPGSPHYSDLLPMWAEGRYAPLVYSRDAVEENTAHRLILRPEGP
ncbi:MAG: penicillin acylase family protein [Bryobacterales bacterium]|nr:penicillin acylase family protein [Bryobacterales bacterium]